MSEITHVHMAIRLPDGTITNSLIADPLAPQVSLDRLTDRIDQLRTDAKDDYGVIPESYSPEIVYRTEVTTTSEWTTDNPLPAPEAQA